jgi:hypothetical protein
MIQLFNGAELHFSARQLQPRSHTPATCILTNFFGSASLPT